MNKVLTKNDEGLPVSLDQLPPIAKNLHWIARRKKSVVEVVQAGLITREAVCVRYGISLEEFLHWEDRFTRHGREGVMVTKTKHFREVESV
ncbi:MAG: DUF1153 domain-containing protein [Patescibacteria group bacterium]